VDIAVGLNARPSIIVAYETFQELGAVPPLTFPPWRGIWKIDQHSFDAFDNNLLLLQLIEGGFAFQLRRRRNRTPEGELADSFPLQ
jgi:hypothetical protein